MPISKEQLKKYRKLAENTAMISALSEYTPQEFIELLDYIEELEARPRGSCEWKLDIEEANVWESVCGRSFWLEDGTPTENEMQFCPYCGRNLVICPVDTCSEGGVHEWLPDWDKDPAMEYCAKCNLRR